MVLLGIYIVKYPSINVIVKSPSHKKPQNIKLFLIELHLIFSTIKLKELLKVSEFNIKHKKLCFFLNVINFKTQIILYIAQNSHFYTKSTE